MDVQQQASPLNEMIITFVVRSVTSVLMAREKLLYINTAGEKSQQVLCVCVCVRALLCVYMHVLNTDAW